MRIGIKSSKYTVVSSKLQIILERKRIGMVLHQEHTTFSFYMKQRLIRNLEYVVISLNCNKKKEIDIDF